MTPESLVVGLLAGALVLGVLTLVPWVSIRWTHYLALGNLAFVAIVPRSTYERLPLPLGIEPPDLLVVLAVVGFVLRRELYESGPSAVPSAIRWPVFVLAALGVVGLVTASARDIELKVAVSDLRLLLPLALIWPLADWLRSPRARAQLFSFVTGVGAVVGLVAVAEFVTGGGTEGTFTRGLGRIFNDRFLMPSVALLWIAVHVALGKAGSTARTAGVSVLCLSGLLVTFQRSAWVSIVLALLGTAVLLRGSYRRVLTRTALPAALVVAAGFGIVSATSGISLSDTSGAGLTRLLSISEGMSDSSVEHRANEAAAIVEGVTASPVVGQGPGAEVTFYSPMYDPVANRMGGDVSTTYVHSSYSWYAYKLGLGAVLAIVTLLVAVVRLLTPTARSTGADDALAGSVIATVGLLTLLSFTGPHLNSSQSVPVLALLAAVAAAVRSGARQPSRRISAERGAEVTG